MCDTILATPGTTSSGAMFFGKNSDRQRNEAQGVEYFQRKDYSTAEPLTCTYIQIPQKLRTHAVLLCRPFWIWGAEMGANEYGVAIGNEGLHAKSAAPRENALTGMDLVRLALERSKSAAEAVHVIISLLKKHGQGGNCGHLIPDYYNNGFAIADANEAYILETIGREWILQRAQGTRAMSNTYSIFTQPESFSIGLPGLLHDFGVSDFPPPNYADAIRDGTREHVGYAGDRRGRTESRLLARRGNLVAADMMSILRDHGTEERWDPTEEPKRTICAHATTEDLPGQTVGAMVSEINRSQAVHWVTGTAAPCLSIFKPLLLDASTLPMGPRPTDQYSSETLWWSHERLHRLVLVGDFVENLQLISPERDAIEADFQTRLREVLNGGDSVDQAQVIAACWNDALILEQRWLERLRKIALRDDNAYLCAWKRHNRLAGLCQ